MQKFREWRRQREEKEREEQQQKQRERDQLHSSRDVDTRTIRPSDTGQQHSVKMDSMERDQAEQQDGTEREPSPPVSLVSDERAARDRRSLFDHLLSDAALFSHLLQYLPRQLAPLVLFLLECKRFNEETFAQQETTKDAEYDTRVQQQAIKLLSRFLQPNSVVVQHIPASVARQLQQLLPPSTNSKDKKEEPTPPSIPLQIPPAVLRLLLDTCVDSVEAYMHTVHIAPFFEYLDEKHVQAEYLKQQHQHAIDKHAADGHLTSTYPIRIHEVYTFTDLAPPTLREEGGGSTSVHHAVYRAFLLFLMESKRHRPLVRYIELCNALSIAAGTEYDADILCKSSGEEESGGTELNTGATVIVTQLKLSQLYHLYSHLEDIYLKLFPDHKGTYIPTQHIMSNSGLLFTLGSPSVHRHSTSSRPDPSSSSSTSPPTDADITGVSVGDEHAEITAQFKRILSERGETAQGDGEGGADGGSKGETIIPNANADPSQYEYDCLHQLVIDLIHKLKPICNKMERILRNEFWPQFTESEYYRKLCKIPRPTIKKDPIPSSTDIKKDNNGTSTSTVAPSTDAPAPAALNTSPPDDSTLLYNMPNTYTLNAAPLTPGAASSPTSPRAPSNPVQFPPASPSISIIPPASPSSAASTSTSSTSSSHARAPLVSSLKQQRVTREMLILECASKREYQQRLHIQRMGMYNVAHPTSTAPANAEEHGHHCHSPAVQDKARVLEYVSIMKCAPILPPHDSTTTNTNISASSAVPSAIGSATAPSSASSAATSKPNLPPRTHILHKRPLSHSPSTTDPPASTTTTTPTQQRGRRILSMCYRYPLQDRGGHAAPLPQQLMELAFPDAADTEHTESLCTCTSSRRVPVLIQQGMAVQDHGIGGVGSRSRQGSAETEANANASTSATNTTTAGASASIPPSSAYDIFGFAQSASHANSTASHERHNYDNRLFNFISTGAEGSVLYGCVLQWTQYETVQEEWEEVSAVEISDIALPNPALAQGNARLSAGGGLAMASGLVQPTAVVHAAGLNVASAPVLKNVSLLSLNLQSNSNVTSENAGSSNTTSSSGTTVSSSTSSASSSSSSSSSSASSPTASATSKLSSLFDSLADNVKELLSNSSSASTTTATVTQSSAASSSESASMSVSSLASSTVSSLVSETASSSVSTSLSAPSLDDATTSRSNSSSPSLGPIAATSLPPRRIVKHSRVWRVPVQYALCILSCQPVLHLLRQASTHLWLRILDQVGKSIDAQDTDDSNPPAIFALANALTASGGNVEPLHTLLSHLSFWQLLYLTHPPVHAIDLFGLRAISVTPSYLTAPVHDFSLDTLFVCLHPRRVLFVIEALLQERKLVIISQSYSLLTLICESLLSLLYPFAWKYLYIPILPYSLFKYLQCPTPFLVGIHSCYRKAMKDMSDREVIMVDVDNDEIHYQQSTLSIPTTTNTTTNNNTTDSLLQPQSAHASFPSPLREHLVQRMQGLYYAPLQELDEGAALSYNEDSTDSMSPYTPHPNSDALKSFHSPSSLHTPSVPTSSIDRAMQLRMEFLKCWAHLLKSYRNFVIYIRGSTHEHIHRDRPILIFDTPSFLGSKPLHYHTFLAALLNTSYFPLFLAERSSSALEHQGMASVERDAFDRYEAALSGARVNVWQAAYAARNAYLHEHHEASSTEPHDAAAADRSGMPSFRVWLEQYQLSGQDPSILDSRYIPAWTKQLAMGYEEVVELVNPSYEEWLKQHGYVPDVKLSSTNTLSVPPLHSSPARSPSSSALRAPLESDAEFHADYDGGTDEERSQSQSTNKEFHADGED